MGLVYLMINHNYSPRPAESKMASTEDLQASRIESGLLSASQAKMQSMTKLEARRWLYEEFKPAKPKKLTLKEMNDYEKEAFCAAQTTTITLLADQRRKIKEHLDHLEDKLDDMWQDFKERRRRELGPSEEEVARKEEMKPMIRQLKELQALSQKLKLDFGQGASFDRLKHLESTKKTKEAAIALLQKHAAELKKALADQQSEVDRVERANAEEVVGR